jgi:hypothetical protein
MSLSLSGIAHRKRIDVVVSGPGQVNHLRIYTGIAVINLNDVMWVINDAIVNESVDIFLGCSAVASPTTGDNFDGNPFTFVSGSATVSLAGVSNLICAQLATLLVPTTPVSRFMKIHVPMQIQGQFTAVLRISYVAFVTASVAPLPPGAIAPPPVKDLQHP